MVVVKRFVLLLLTECTYVALSLLLGYDRRDGSARAKPSLMFKTRLLSTFFIIQKYRMFNNKQASTRLHLLLCRQAHACALALLLDLLLLLLYRR